MQDTTITRQELCQHRRWTEAQLDAARSLGHPSGRIRVKTTPFSWKELTAWMYDRASSDDWVATFAGLMSGSDRWPVSFVVLDATSFVDRSAVLAALGWSNAELAVAKASLNFPRAAIMHREVDGVRQVTPSYLRHEMDRWLTSVRAVLGVAAYAAPPAA